MLMKWSCRIRTTDQYESPECLSVWSVCSSVMSVSLSWVKESYLQVSMRAAVQQSDTQNRLTHQLLSDRVSELRVRTHIEQQLQQATQQHVDTTQHPARQTDCESCWTVSLWMFVFLDGLFSWMYRFIFSVCFFSLFSYLLMRSNEIYISHVNYGSPAEVLTVAKQLWWFSAAPPGSSVDSSPQVDLWPPGSPAPPAPPVVGVCTWPRPSWSHTQNKHPLRISFRLLPPPAVTGWIWSAPSYLSMYGGRAET